jgi:hypothetical protein
MNTVQPLSIISEGTVKRNSICEKTDLKNEMLQNTRKPQKMKILNFTLAPTEIKQTEVRLIPVWKLHFGCLL